MPALAIMAPPPYAALLLGRDVLAAPTSDGVVDAGLADARASGGEPRKPAGQPNWSDIMRRASKVKKAPCPTTPRS
jgi:hypothetical protein